MDDEREQFALELEGTEAAYLHLQDAQIHGAGATPIRLRFWRARLADVSGWTFRGGEGGPQ